MMRTRGRSACSPATSLPTAAPVQRIVPSEASTNCSSGAADKPRGARGDLAGQRLLRGVLQRLGLGAARRSIRQKDKAVEAADGVALDHDFAGLAHFRLKLGVFAQPPHQHAGAAIDEALGQPLVQRIGQLVFRRARDALPMLGIGQPIRRGWRQTSRSGYGRCGSTAYRCRRRSGRPARSGARTSRSGFCPRASDSRRA